MIKTVIFDFDGVIVDSERVVLGGFQYGAEKMNLTGIDIENLFLKCVGTNHEHTKQVLYDSLGKDFSYEEFHGYTHEYFVEYTRNNGLPVKKGVRELLQYLKKEDYKIALASSSSFDYLKRELTRAGLIDYFQIIVSGEKLEHGKPAPDIYLIACEKVQTDPQNAYAIEDSYNGIRSASSAGMKAIMVPDLLPATEEMEKLSCCIFENLFEVKEYLEAALS